MNPVRRVAVLLMVQGCAEIALAVVYGAFVASAARAPGGGLLPPGMTTVVGALSGLVLATGVLKVVAGVLNHGYRGRTVGLVALASGVVPALTCVCAPTALALLVHGVRVYARPWPAPAPAVDRPGIRV